MKLVNVTFVVDIQVVIHKTLFFMDNSIVTSWYIRVQHLVYNCTVILSNGIYLNRWLLRSSTFLIWKVALFSWFKQALEKLDFSPKKKWNVTLRTSRTTTICPPISLSSWVLTPSPLFLLNYADICNWIASSIVLLNISHSAVKYLCMSQLSPVLDSAISKCIVL